MRIRASEPHLRGTLLVADRVVTMGHGRRAARALLVRGSRVAWVGDDPDTAPRHATRIELDGCTIGPGFVDAHVHLTPTGLTLGSLDLRGVTSPEEVLARVRRHARTSPGRVLWGHGWDMDLDPVPDADDLAAAAEGMTVFLSRIDSHSALVDRRTVTSAPFARAQGLDVGSDGDPTGLVRLEANKIARRWAVGAMSEAQLSAARQRAVAHVAATGVVSVHEMGGPDLMGVADFDAWVEGEWPIEVVPWWGGLDLEFVAERGLPRLGGDLFLDGSLGSHTAALSAPYADGPGHGRLELDDATLVDLLRRAAEAELQTAFHAIGDAAISQLLTAWRKVAASLPEHLDVVRRRARHRIEHAELLPEGAVADLVDLDLVVSVQPSFEAIWGGPGGLYERRLGPERAATTNPLRELADHGVPIAFGSDSNVTAVDPWAAIHAAQHRRHRNHALSRTEAASAHVLGGRHAAGQNAGVGVLRAGMRADLAAWEGDPFAADDPRGATCVLSTVAGRVASGVGAPGTPLRELS